VIEEGYASFLLADEAIRLLDAATDEKPLFLVLSFNAAHPPLQAPQELLDRYAAVENPVRRAYAAMLDGLDRALGRVLDALDDKGRTAETLVFFLGDNGASTDHGGANGPLRGGKATTFEGGIRVPAIVRWPARLAPGSSGQVLSVLDVAPTLLAAVGIDPGTRNLDGQSYWRALLAGEIRPHQGLVVATQHRWMRQEALLDPRGKLVRETNVVDGTRRQALFDPMADPGETRDLSSERPDLVKELEERLDADLSLHPEDYVRPTWEAPAGWKPPGDWARATAIPGGR
jgi:arylsulfatase A-like enzyme